MGNKRRRVKVIFGVILSAFMSLAGVLSVFIYNASGSTKPTVNAAIYDYYSYDGDSINCQKSVSLPMEYYSVYYIEFAGQKGGSDPNNAIYSGGKGAQAYGFFKRSDGYCQGTIGTGGGVSGDPAEGGHGGGGTKVQLNFALPNGTSAGDAWAGGGGGAGIGEDHTSGHKDYGAAGGSAGWYSGNKGGDVEHSGHYQNGGTGATQVADGVPWELRATDDEGFGMGGGGYHKGGDGGHQLRKTNPWRRLKSAGGGGCCSPNSYPLGGTDVGYDSSHSGNGYIRAYRIDPDVRIYSKSGRLGDTLKVEMQSVGYKRYSLSECNSRVAANLALTWVFRYQDNGGQWSGWTTDMNALSWSTLGTRNCEAAYVIYATGSVTKDTAYYPVAYNFKHTSPASAANDANYVITKESFSFTIYGNATVASAPSANTGLKYDGTDQQLLYADGSATNGSMRYSLDNSNWYSSIISITGKNPGSYTVYYKAVGSGYYGDSGVGSLTVTIGKGTTSLSAAGLSGKNLTYTGSAQSLFSGGGSSNAPSGYGGTISYAWSTSSNGSNKQDESTTLANLKATDACNSSGTQYTYYLFYKMAASTYYNAIDWTYSGISTTIKKAKYSATCTINSAATYDGNNHNIFETAPTIKSDSGAPNTLISVEYSRTYTSWNGSVVNAPGTSDVLTLKTARDAGEYGLKVTTKPLTAYANQIETNITILGPYTINKTQNAGTIKLSGLAYDDSNTYELDETASAYPFRPYIPAGKATLELDMTVCGVAEYNGLTTNNPNNKNQLGYLLTQKSGYPDENTVNDIDYTGATKGFIEIPANKLNETITNMAAHYLGVWYLWLNIVNHNSVENAMFMVAQFSCAGFNDAKVKLTGLTMTGAITAGLDGKITYDGLDHPLIKSGTGIKADPSQAALDFVGVEYAMSTNSNHSALSTLEGKWQSLDEVPEDQRLAKLQELFQAKDVNTYYLWVRWGESRNLQGTSGIIYAHMEIEQLVVNKNATFYSSGVNFTWPDHRSDNSLEIYSAPFNNAQQTIGSISDEADIRTYNLAGTELTADLIGYGHLSFGVSTSYETMNGVYYGYDEFSKVTVMEKNTYYLWMSWPGSANVSAGEMVYRVKKPSDNTTDPVERITPCFEVEQLTNPSTTTLDYSVKDINGTKEHEYLWQFVYYPTSTTDDPSGQYQGVAQALFSTDVTPSIKIGGFIYSAPSVTFKYMLSTDSATVTHETPKLSTNSGWVNSLDQAVMTDVNDYYLWVWVSVDDANVNINKTFSVANGVVNGSASIVTTESFVRIAPRPVTQEYKGFRRDVFTKSGQDAPAVEYALFKVDYENDNAETQLDIKDKDEIDDDNDKYGVYVDDITGWKWSADTRANALRPIEVGLYKIYYRGASLKYEGDDRYYFYTQKVPTGGYPYIMVEIIQVGANIEIAPLANYVVYRGTPFEANELFTRGYAKTHDYTPAEETEDGKQIGEHQLELLYSWDNKTWCSYELLETKIKAGYYPLYYKPDADRYKFLDKAEMDQQVSTLTIQIAKASIALDQPWFNGETSLVYKAAGYQLFENQVDYAMVDQYGVPLQDSAKRTISFKNGDNGCSMGMIYYAVTTGENQYPKASDWYDNANFYKVVAQQTGSYYLWLKVAEGENHLALNDVCYNAGYPFKITAAKNVDDNIRLTKSTYKAVSNLRYNGLSRAMLTELNLRIEVADRDDQGELNPKNGELKYNEMPSTDRLAKVYYALKNSPVDFPGDNNFGEDGWQTNWETLRQTDAGKYYLLIRISYADDSNIEAFNFCLSELPTLDDTTERDELRIASATYDMLSLSGISGITKMFTNGYQQIAVGKLKATIQSSRYDITDQIDEDKYFYLNTDKGDTLPDANSNWQSFNDTLARSVGKYQLYVNLKMKKNKNDTYNVENVDLIYPLLLDPSAEHKDEDFYAEITRVDANNVNIVAPIFAQNLFYNGTPQSLITVGARVEMKVGDSVYGVSLERGTGPAYYYISGSNLEITEYGTVDGGKTNKYTDWANAVKQQHAGTYYIWVEFVYDEDVDYDPMEPVYVGSVTIAQATEANIKLSGIDFTNPYYNGEQHVVFDGNVIQTINTNNHVLTADADEYSKVEYAYSDDPYVSPLESLWTEYLPSLMACNAGNYYLWVRVTGKEITINGKEGIKDVADYFKCYYFDPANDFTRIEKSTLDVDNFDGVRIHEGLSYIGESQILADIPEKLRLVLIPNNDKNQEHDLNTTKDNADIEFYWGLGSGKGETRETQYTEAPEKWLINITDVQATNAGKYYLWIKVPACKNFFEYQACFAVIDIDKATIEFLEPEKETTLVYKGDYQELLRTPTVTKFRAEGKFYDPNPSYYNTTSDVTIQYRILRRNASYETTDPTNNYREIIGLNAGDYVVEYWVEEADNWKESKESIIVTIAAVDASAAGVGLAEAPMALTNLAYNEEEQDLISFGRLVDSLPVAGCGTALEGSFIIFNYQGSTDYFYYEYHNGEYSWRNGNKLPGRIDHGKYYIEYQVSEGTTGNYRPSAVIPLEITINQREVYWITTPEPQLGLKYTGTPQDSLVAGQLNVGDNAEGVKVMYTAIDRDQANRNWDSEMPKINGVGLWPVWYYVEVNTDGKNNNVFVDPVTSANNSRDTGILVVVWVERYVLTIRDYPQDINLMYNGEEQNLAPYASLSTDDANDFGDKKKPYFKYRFENESKWYDKIITKKETGNYTIYYKVEYDPEIFDFRDEKDDSLKVFTAQIDGMYISLDSIRAEYDEENDVLVHKIATKQVLNSEGEIEEVPLYSDAFMSACKISYFYRMRDEYNQKSGWVEWFNGKTQIEDLGLGTYQFRLEITSENGECYPYTQPGIEKAYDSFTYRENRVLKIVMHDYNTPAYVRAWIDFTGKMTYEDADPNYRQEGWVENGSWDIVFKEVGSSGDRSRSKIKLETINGNYYYITEDNLTEAKKKSILNDDKLRKSVGVTKTFNNGLLIAEPINVNIYEVYRIQYDSNGGEGIDIADGWKWHNLDYMLAENTFMKAENGQPLTANGWNTSAAGNGSAYGSGSLWYKEDASQKFYARFFDGNNFYTIQWIIQDSPTNPTKKYALSRTGVWFDTSLEEYQSRDTGILVAEGDLILLPQIQTDENGTSLSQIFGGLISHWRSADDSFEYRASMLAERNITFVADLKYDVTDSVECKFFDDQGNEVHDSGLLANGASAYMALSGMDINTVRNYQDGYEKWVHDHGFDKLDKANTNTSANGVITYDLGTKRMIEEPKEDDGGSSSTGDYIIMAVILILGVVAVIASLTVYIIMRKKHHQVNLKNFKEETKGRMTV